MIQAGDYGYMCDDWELKFQWGWIVGLYVWPLLLFFFYSVGKWNREEWSGKPALWSFTLLAIGWPLVDRWITYSMLVKKFPQTLENAPWLNRPPLVDLIFGFLALVSVMLFCIYFVVWTCGTIKEEN
jgi:hypothetical protein